MYIKRQGEKLECPAVRTTINIDHVKLGEGKKAVLYFKSESLGRYNFVIFRFSDIQTRRVPIGKCISRRASFAVAQQKVPKGASSVADPGCLSRIPDPDFYPSRILDLGSRIQNQQQERGEKNMLSHLFL